jgi:hypothetical protein
VDALTAALALMDGSDAHPALQNAALRLALAPELLPRLAVPPAEPVRTRALVAVSTHHLRAGISVRQHILAKN